VDHLSSGSRRGQAHEQEWKLRFEKEKQAWREEAAAKSLIRDSDQVLMRKELRDIRSRLRLLQVSYLREVFRIFFDEIVCLETFFIIKRKC
jgi:hypothetical protein